MDKVVIVGGGLGGLLLALLLEKASLDYIVLERSTMARMPLEGGGVIFITSQIQPLLQQLGLLSRLRQLSRPVGGVTLIEVKQGLVQLKTAGVIDSEISSSSYYTMAISRPELYNYLVDQVPAKKLLLDKKVQDVFQKGSVASCVCADGSSYSGIIIGADGAYSSVRLSLYRHLRNQGQLAPQDCQPMQYRYRALVGMTRTLDSDRFVLMKTQHSDVRFAVSNGSKSFTFWCVPMTKNRMCWMLDEPLAVPVDCPEVEDWSGNEQAVHEICKTYRSMQSPIEGFLLGELFDLTPAGTMLSLPREEGFFSTWVHGKIALMGDACHKALPYGGQPFAQAGYDAVELANILYAHSRSLDQGYTTADSSSMDVAARLRSFEAERRSVARDAVKGSHYMGRLLSRQDWIGTTVRYILLNYVPRVILLAMVDRLIRRRPQAAFLPKII